MKRITIFLMLLMVAMLASTSSSYAEIQEFTKFTLDIPENWIAHEEGQIVSVVRSDDKASITITIAAIENQTLKDLAEAFCETLGGSDLFQDKDGNYGFSFNGGEGATLLASTGEEYIFFAMNGLSEARGEIANILSSLKDK